MRLPVAAALAALVAASCDAQGLKGIRLEAVAQGLDRPLYAAAPAGDPRLFIVEQGGVVRILRGGRVLPAPFLDLRGRVSAGGERGLLSIAFHPRYSANGCFYVDYTDARGDTVISRFSVSADPDRADPASERLVLGIAQPYANHNGGHVMFGPDGMLYIGMGDGGSGGDPQGNAQDRATLLGGLLRIDVDSGDPYSIPPGNPLAGMPGLRGEIWSWGLRNPWRFDFDPARGLLYIADVGQNAWEEIDVVPASRGGLNFGWNLMEGSHPYEPAGRSTAGLVAPVVEYPHSDGCSVTGGFVYRGKAIPELAGRYFYADYCRGWIRSFLFVDGRAAEPRTWDLDDVGRILSFGRDSDGELYVLTDTGGVFRITPVR